MIAGEIHSTNDFLNWFAAMPRMTFTLRTLFVVLTLLCVGLGTWVRRAEHQRRLVAEIVKEGGDVHYNDETGIQMGGLVWLPRDPRWYERWIGRDYYSSVIHVSFHYSKRPNPRVADPISKIQSLECVEFGFATNLTDAEVEKLSQLKQLKKLSFRSYAITDEGLLRLAALHNLERLSLRQSTTLLTDRGVATLALRLPQTTIHWHSAHHDEGSWSKWYNSPTTGKYEPEPGKF